jgi:hypothetical protein
MVALERWLHQAEVERRIVEGNKRLRDERDFRRDTKAPAMVETKDVRPR